MIESICLLLFIIIHYRAQLIVLSTLLLLWYIEPCESQSVQYSIPMCKGDGVSVKIPNSRQWQTTVVKCQEKSWLCTTYEKKPTAWIKGIMSTDMDPLLGKVDYEYCSTQEAGYYRMRITQNNLA